MALIEVRPIEKEKWHGKKGKDSFARPVVVEALVNVRTNLYDTGLSTEEQDKLEKSTGLNLSNIYIKDKPHPFWSTSQAQIKLPNSTKIFDTSKPLDEIAVKVLKASELVANSVREYEEGKFPFASHVIFDEREEVEIKASKIAIKKETIIESSKLSRAKKVEIIQVLSNKSMKKQSDEFVEVELDKLIEESPERVLNLIKADKVDTTVHSMILEGLEKNILRKEGSGIYYMDDQLGYDITSAIGYFKDPSNQKLKAEITEKLK